MSRFSLGRYTDFVLKLNEIVKAGNEALIAAAQARGRSGRCGTKIELRAAPRCGETVYRWWAPWSKTRIVPIDRYANCGRKPGETYTDEENEFYKKVIDCRLTEERPYISSIFESVQAAVRSENARRFALSTPEPELAVPGYDWVRGLIARYAPIDHEVRRHGMDVAYRDLHPLGLGLQLSRVLERVELDEYTVDLMVFMRMIGLLPILTPDEARSLGLDGQPKRLVLSAAIDVFSGAIVGLQIALTSSVDVTLRTIEMIYLDKQPLADAVGAQMVWPMRGQPQSIALDRASINMSDEVYHRLCLAGITNFAVPAAKPYLKGRIERFFSQFGALFLQRFTGRTFSDVVRKGENDPAARATVTLDEFLFWLTRWIVDVYHTRKPETLGKKSPLEIWNDAVSVCPPLVRADLAMLRNAFGVTFKRRVTREGVTVKGIRYQHEEIAKWFLNETERELTVVWWDKQIGSIDVHLPDGSWVTAHCVDPAWADKTYRDLVQQQLVDEEAKLFGQAARDQAIVEMDAELVRKSALRHLLPTAPSAAELAKRTSDFSRYMISEERRPDTYGDVFDNEVKPDVAGGTGPQGQQSMPAPLTSRKGHIME